MHVGNLDLSVDDNRKRISTRRDRNTAGKDAIRNGDGTALTIAQIAAAANLTTAQVTDIAGRI